MVSAVVGMEVLVWGTEGAMRTQIVDGGIPSLRPHPVCWTELRAGWTGVESGVVEMGQLILGTYGVAGSAVVQDRKVCVPTPAIGSG